MMQLRIFIWLALTLACALLAVPGARAQNLVQNGGFESGLLHWTWKTNGGTAATCVLDAAQHHWGQSCVRLAYRAARRGGVSGRLTQRVSGLTVGKTYYAYLWCKGRGVGAACQLAAGSRGQFRAPLPPGDYDWRCVELGFVADAPAMDVGVLVQGMTSALWIDDLYLTAVRRTNAGSVGVAGSTGADVTAALQAALNTYKFVYLPAGIYHISGPVHLPVGALLWGDGRGTVLQETDRTNKAHLLDSFGTATAYAGHNEVCGVKFVGVPKVYQYGIDLAKTQNILIQNCFTQSCALVDAEALTGYSQVASEDDLNRNIVVTGSDVEATHENRGAAEGILLRYTADAQVSHNTVNFFGQGITWWGGDSNFARDGAFSHPRWARRIRIFGNTVAHSAGAGIWGSMGQDITVSHNHVSDCNDVGIDFEGCFDSTADSNTVADAHNGGLSTFFAAKNITFSRNTVSTSHPDWPLFRSYNNSLDPSFGAKHLAGLGCVFQGNTFLCTSGIGIIDDHNGPNVLTFQDNTLTNVRINISHVGNGANSLAPTIIGNTLTFRTDIPDFYAGINVFSNAGDAIVSRNTLTYLGVSGANKTGIQVQTQPNMSSAIRVTGNTIRGFGLADIFVYCYPPGKNTALVRANHVGGKTINIGPGSAVTVQAEGNTDGIAAAVAYKRVEEADKPQNHIVE